METKFKDQYYSVLVSPTHVQELCQIKQDDFGVEIGANVTLSKVESVLKEVINSLEGTEKTKPRSFPALEGLSNVISESKTRIFAAIVEMLRWFAGHQIRNVAVGLHKIN